MAKNIHLFLPGIIHPRADWAAKMPSLSQLIRKADLSADKRVIDSKLNDIFDLEPSNYFPFAALSAFGEGLFCQTPYWIHADPVLLQVGPQGGFLKTADMNLCPEDAIEIETALQALFLPYEMLFFIRGKKGYVNLPTVPDITTNSLRDVIEKNVHQRLPSGPEAAFWNRLLTECQMLLKTKADTYSRFNSLWFWGEGTLPKRGSCSFERLVSDEPFIKGLSELSHTHYSTLEDWLALCQKSLTSAFVLTFSFDLLVRQQNYEDWVCLAHEWEKQCFEPLLKALQRGEVDQLSIDIGQASFFQIKQRHLYYFWRRQHHDSQSDYSI
ncbi:MAG: hypothetical protein U1E78_10040 [Gammaproteobacteria bacterium]